MLAIKDNVMSRLIPQYNMPTADVGGALAGVLQTSKATSEGLGTIASTLQQNAATNEQLRAKAVEEQRLANLLALQQQQAEQTALHNAATLEQRKQEMLQYDKHFAARMANTEAQQATDRYTNEAIADIMSQPSPQKQRERLDYFMKMGGFNPDPRTLMALQESWQPKPQEYKPIKMHAVNEKGDVITVTTRSPEEEKHFIEMGYGYGEFKGGKSGDNDNNTRAKAEKEMAAYNKLISTVGEFGWYDKDEARENIKTLQGMGIPAVFVERALIAAKDKEWWQGRRFDLNTIDNELGSFQTKDGETVKLGTFIQRAREAGAEVRYNELTGTLEMVKPAITRPKDENKSASPNSLRSVGRVVPSLDDIVVGNEWMGPSLRDIGVGHQRMRPSADYFLYN